MSTKVVVVVRTKDRPLLLRRALASVAAQTWTDLVAVVVNDGGAPGPVDEAAAESGLGERVTVVHHEQSKGRSEAINAGLDAVAGELFAIHDDDDTWDPDFLGQTVAWLDAHPEAVAVATRTAVVREEIRGDEVVELDREVLAEDVDEITLVATAWQNYVPPIAMLIRTSVLERVGRFDPALPVLEDWDFNLRLLAAGPMGFLPARPLAFWRHRPGASGSEGNSVIAESGDHAAYDGRIREQYLRADLAGRGTGLGNLLAVTQVLRDMQRDSDQRWATHSDVVDRWNTGHQEHLTTVATTLSLEVGRLRGELLALEERVAAIAEGLKGAHKELRRQIRADNKPVRQRLRQVSQRVDDLWESDKGVARLVRRRERESGR